MIDSGTSVTGKELAQAEAQRIHVLDPHNELISLCIFKGSQLAWNVLFHEFTERFDKEDFLGEQCKGEMPLGDFWDKYHLALKKLRVALEAKKIAV